MARDGRFERCLGLLGGCVDVFDEAAMNSPDMAPNPSPA
jgi:hypothetical protein